MGVAAPFPFGRPLLCHSAHGVPLLAMAPLQITPLQVVEKVKDVSWASLGRNGSRGC